MQNLLRTPSSSSMCGVTLQVGETYVLNGRIVSGQALISSCGLSIRWADTTSRQRKGLRQLYQPGCVCDVSWIILSVRFQIYLKQSFFNIENIFNIEKIPYMLHNFLKNIIWYSVKLKWKTWKFLNFAKNAAFYNLSQFALFYIIGVFFMIIIKFAYYNIFWINKIIKLERRDS